MAPHSNAAADAMKLGALQQTLQRYRSTAAEEVQRSRSADFVSLPLSSRLEFPSVTVPVTPLWNGLRSVSLLAGVIILFSPIDFH